MSGDIDAPKRLVDLLAEADRLMWSGARGAAIALLEGALAWQLSDVERYDVGERLLRASNCRRGWDLYDLHPSRPVDRLRRVQRWNGEPCRLLIVMAEQGFGDAIQFLRFVPQVADLAETVVVAVHDELLDVLTGSRVLRGCTVISRSVARKTRWPADARWERLMSIPAKIDRPVPGVADAYLRLRAAPSLRLSPASTGVQTVGVAWRSTRRRGFPNRSFPARLATKLLDPGDVRVVTLHRTQDIRALPPGIEEVGIGNFKDTAEVISQCDYVVTADTVTAHLASALGIPTLICLLHRPDWRWGSPANPTRWYASAQLLFQEPTGEWAPLLSTAAERISQRGAAPGTPEPHAREESRMSDESSATLAMRLATALGVPLELLVELRGLHQRQWDLEDHTRERGASAERIAAAKADIDACNSQRHRLIDSIDTHATHAAHCDSARSRRYYSETVGELCDRLLILDMKERALAAVCSSDRSGAGESLGLQRIGEVRRHMAAVIGQLIEEIAIGQAVLPPRVGVKVYNGSASNAPTGSAPVAGSTSVAGE